MNKIRSVPTLEDVAKVAGVSTATVSRCLNLPDRVVPKTRERVMQAVEVLGYTPNFSARIMAANRSFTIGAIIPTMENSIFAKGLQAFQDELQTRGYTLLVSSSVYKPEIEEEQIKTFVSRGVDGLLLIGHEREERICEYLEKQKIPTLVAWSYLPNSSLPSVGFCNRKAMFVLAERVIKTGHKDIAMISGIKSGNDRAFHRFKGIEDALLANGLDPKSLTVIETSYGVESGATAFNKLMSCEKRPTVVMCGNDVLAAGALLEAKRMGIAVPDNVSITGFDDIELANIVDPALTTVHVPHREMGRKAAEELISMVEGKSEGRSTLIETHVKFRKSLAKPSRD